MSEATSIPSSAPFFYGSLAGRPPFSAEVPDPSAAVEAALMQTPASQNSRISSVFMLLSFDAR